MTSASAASQATGGPMNYNEPVELATTYRDGVTWRPRQLSPGQGLLALLENTIPAQRRPKAVLRTLHAVTGQATTLKGARGDAEGLARRILGKLDDLDPSGFEDNGQRS